MPAPRNQHIQAAPVQKMTQRQAAAPHIQPQIVNVPQFAGYDQNNQPIYTYVQMQLVGQDTNGQPIFAPLQNQPTPAPVQQMVQSAPAQPQSPVQAAPLRNVPRTAPTANISKIAVNPHSKNTSQAFINAIAESKEYANKNLIETQGLQARMPVLTSVEDVLSTMGDDSAKKKQMAQQNTQSNVPVYKEYKAPTASSMGAKKKQDEKDNRPLSRAELKAKKKQDKIDAKFKKDLAKRGF